MSDDWSTFKRIGDDISFDDLVEFSAEDEVASSVLRDASSEGTSTQAGLQTRSLQSAMDNYAAAIIQINVRAAFDDQLIVDVTDDEAVPKSLHGVAEDVAADGLDDVLHELRTVGFDAFPFLC